jgi:hypothetical protein
MVSSANDRLHCQPGVTHVPGLTCHLCARVFTEAAPKLSPCIPPRYRARDLGCTRSCCVKAEAARSHRSAGSRPCCALILRAAC